MNIDNFNEWIDENINSIEVPNEEWVHTNDILDWMMQKHWSKNVVFQSWPDGQNHIAYQGLKEVFDHLQKAYNSISKMRALYNQRLYELQQQIEQLQEDASSVNVQKLQKIRAILDSK